MVSVDSCAVFPGVMEEGSKLAVAPEGSPLAENVMGSAKAPPVGEAVRVTAAGSPGNTDAEPALSVRAKLLTCSEILVEVLPLKTASPE